MQAWYPQKTMFRALRAYCSACGQITLNLSNKQALAGLAGLKNKSGGRAWS